MDSWNLKEHSLKKIRNLLYHWLLCDLTVFLVVQLLYHFSVVSSSPIPVLNHQPTNMQWLVGESIPPKFQNELDKRILSSTMLKAFWKSMSTINARSCRKI